MISYTSYAGALTSINNDTCWYKEDNSRVKIASFNDKLNMNTNKDLVLGDFVKYLHGAKFEASKIDSIHTYGLCGPRLAFAFKVSYEKIDYCVHATVENSAFKFGNISLSSGRSGACEQISPSKLIVSIDEKSNAALGQYLTEQGRRVKGISKISNSAFVYEFSVARDEIKDIKKEVESFELTRSVDFSSGQYHIADEFELLSLSYFRK